MHCTLCAYRVRSIRNTSKYSAKCEHGKQLKFQACGKFNKYALYNFTRNQIYEILFDWWSRDTVYLLKWIFDLVIDIVAALYLYRNVFDWWLENIFDLFIKYYVQHKVF